MHDGLGYIRVRSPLLAESLLFSFPVGIEMVHFPTLSLTAYVFSGGFSRISLRGFPHSETPGSKLICSSPGLIAAYRVLHRLLVPRHSPYTLSSLTIRNSTYIFSPPRRPSPPRNEKTCEPYAHCVCVVGKNYRLQNIQLSKRPNRPCRSVIPKRGGEYRARTGDLLVANQALSQLS